MQSLASQKRSDTASAPPRRVARTSACAFAARALATVLLLLSATTSRADDAIHLRLEVPSNGIRNAAVAAEKAVRTAFKEANPNVVIDPYVRLRI